MRVSSGVVVAVVVDVVVMVMADALNALNVYLFKSSRRLQDSSSYIPKIKSTGTNQMPMDFALCKKKVAMSRHFSLSRDNHVILTRHILLIRSTTINTYSVKI